MCYHALPLQIAKKTPRRRQTTLNTAWSEAGEVGGTAGRVELRHQDEKNEVRVYWGRADNTFSNSAAIRSAGRVESGVKLVRKLSASTRLLAKRPSSFLHEFYAALSIA